MLTASGAEGPLRFALTPRVSSVVIPRPRLLARLDEATRAPLTIVRAPAGGGKSALVADWAMRRGIDGARGLWLSVDESAGSRPAFWQDFLASAAASGITPRSRGLADIAMSADVLPQLRGLLARGLDDLDEDLLLVVDDFQNVDDPLVEDDLAWLLQHSRRVRAVVLSRAVTRFEDPLARAQLETSVITPAELPLTLEETIALSQRFGLREADAAQLHEAFGGWPLATVSVLIDMQTGRRSSLAEAIGAFGIDPRGRNRLTDLPLDDHLHFMLRTSIAPTMNRELAIRLGGTDAERHLERAEQEGLGTWRDGPLRSAPLVPTAPPGRTPPPVDPSVLRARSEPIFSYQPAMRAAFEAEAERRIPRELPPLRRELALALDRSGDVLGALAQAVRIADWDLVDEIVKHHTVPILMYHQPETRRILEGIPGAVVRRHPLQLVMLAILLYASGPTSVEKLTTMVAMGVASIRGRLTAAGGADRAWLQTALMGARRVAGHYESALEAARATVETLGTLQPEEIASLGENILVSWTQSGTSFLYAGLLDEADVVFENAAAAAAEQDAPWSDVHAHSMRALTMALLGDMTAVRALVAEAHARTRPLGWRGNYVASGYHIAAALLALEEFDPDEARAQLGSLAEHEETLEHWPLIAWVRALAALVEGRPYHGVEELEHDVAAHRRRPPTSAYMAGLLDSARIDLLLAAGHSERAAKAAASASRSHERVTLSRARLELDAGRPEAALRLVRDLAWNDGHRPALSSHALLLAAVAARRAGNDEVARDAVARAVAILETRSLRLPLLTVPRADLAPLLEGVESSIDLVGAPDVFTSSAPRPRLSPAEARVLDALARTAHIDEIAAELHLSVNTVKTHLKRIYRKLGTSSRDETLVAMHDRGLLD